MRKHFLFAGILLAAALIFAGPSKADSVSYSITGPGLSVTFTLPQTFTPTAGTNPFIVTNVSGTLNGSPLTMTIEFGLSGAGGVTNYLTFGSNGVPGFAGTSGWYFGVFAPDLFTINGDGTITLTGNPLTLGDYHLFQGGTSHPYTGTTTVTSTPEPATLGLLGLGGITLVGLLRRKAA